MCRHRRRCRPSNKCMIRLSAAASCRLVRVLFSGFSQACIHTYPTWLKWTGTSHWIHWYLLRALVKRIIIIECKRPTTSAIINRNERETEQKNSVLLLLFIIISTEKCVVARLGLTQNNSTKGHRQGPTSRRVDAFIEIKSLNSVSSFCIIFYAAFLPAPVSVPCELCQNWWVRVYPATQVIRMPRKIHPSDLRMRERQSFQVRYKVTNSANSKGNSFE